MLGIPVVSSCMAPPSIYRTAIGEGVPIVARAPARPTSGARARDRGVFCDPLTHNSLSRQTFRSPQLSRVASKPENVGVTHEHRLVVGGGSSTTSGAAGLVRQGNDGDIHGRTGPASSKLMHWSSESRSDPRGSTLY